MSEVAAGNAAMRDAWDGDTGAFWAEHADRFDAAVAAHREPFLEAAGVVGGESVLDVGCGAGQTTLDLAPRAAPAIVTGIDLSTRLLAIASRRAAAAGLANAVFEHGDAQVHPFPPGGTDVVVSRHGTMFFADKPAAFANLARALRPGGRMVLLTYVSADRLSLFHIRMHDLANPNPAVEVAIPLGASGTVEAVTVNGQAGETVRGAYGADGAWDAAAPEQALAWRAGDVLYVITTHEQGTRLSTAELLAIAESIGK